jgi:hypothetical protein
MNLFRSVRARVGNAPAVSIEKEAEAGMLPLFARFRYHFGENGILLQFRYILDANMCYNEHTSWKSMPVLGEKDR